MGAGRGAARSPGQQPGHKRTMLGVAIPGIAPLAPGIPKDPLDRLACARPGHAGPGVPPAPQTQTRFKLPRPTVVPRRAAPPKQSAAHRAADRAHYSAPSRSSVGSAGRGRGGVRVSLAKPGAASGRSARRRDRHRSASHHLRHVPGWHRAAHRRDQIQGRLARRRSRARLSARCGRKHVHGRRRSAHQRPRREGLAHREDWLPHPAGSRRGSTRIGRFCASWSTELRSPRW